MSVVFRLGYETEGKRGMECVDCGSLVGSFCTNSAAPVDALFPVQSSKQPERSGLGIAIDALNNFEQ